jgi:hypothetical protein
MLKLPLDMIQDQIEYKKVSSYNKMEIFDGSSRFQLPSAESQRQLKIMENQD